MKHILKCLSCRSYTMKDICPYCSGTAVSPNPPKYSPEDKYAKYRREAKKRMEQEE